MGLDLSHYIPALDGVDYFTVDELKLNPEFIKQFCHLFQVMKFDDQAFEVLYITEIGYQRKGMNKRFYEEFENDQLYFSISDVRKAKAYIEGMSESDTNNLLKSFQQNFIDNFTEGESIFIVSW